MNSRLGLKNWQQMGPIGCDHIMWALDVKGLLEHLTSDMIMSDYSVAGTVDRLVPEAQWKRDEAMVKQLVASSVHQQNQLWFGGSEVFEVSSLCNEVPPNFERALMLYLDKAESTGVGVG
jgi:hypothetical protein